MFSKYNEIAVAKLESILEALSAPGILDLTLYDILIYGGGGQSKSFYNELRSDQEVEILWSGWPGPGWMSFLSFIPSQAGLVKVLKPGRVKPLYEELASLSVSDFYYIRKGLTETILEEVSKHPSLHNSKRLLKGETSFFYMQTEMDETVMRNGEECYLYDVVIGQDLPESIRTLFS